AAAATAPTTGGSRVASTSTTSTTTSRRGIGRIADRVDTVGRVVAQLPSVVLVLDPLGVRAAVALELRFDPVHCRAVAIGALPAITELGQALDRRLVPVEIEARDDRFDLLET